MCAVAVTERRGRRSRTRRSGRAGQAQQSRLLFVDASIYVRQYFYECCLAAVMTPVRRLQTGHHTVVVEVADNLCGHSPLCQFGNERQIRQFFCSSASNRDDLSSGVMTACLCDDGSRPSRSEALIIAVTYGSSETALVKVLSDIYAGVDEQQATLLGLPCST